MQIPALFEIWNPAGGCVFRNRASDAVDLSRVEITAAKLHGIEEGIVLELDQDAGAPQTLHVRDHPRIGHRHDAAAETIVIPLDGVLDFADAESLVFFEI